MLRILELLGFDQLNFELNPLGYHSVPCDNPLGFKLERLNDNRRTT